MNYIELRPLRHNHTNEYLGDKVRINYPVIAGTQHLSIYLGMYTAQKFGFKAGDRVILLLGEQGDGEKVIRIKKDENGWKLNKNGQTLKLQFVWHQDVPKREKEVLRFAGFEMSEGFLQIKLPGFQKDGSDNE